MPKWVEQSQGRHTGKLQDLGGKVLKDRGGVDGSFCTYADVVLRAPLEVSVNTANRELFKQGRVSQRSSLFMRTLCADDRCRLPGCGGA